MSELIGKSLGSYRILEQIGVGGMATIYKAYQPGMDRDVAIKILPHYLAKDDQFVQRFQQEARAIAKLEHAHILPVFDYGEYEGTTYIAMRYVKAGTLKEYMSNGQLPLDEISRIIGQIGSALDYAHQKGIIHRDVKPSNVLIDDQGNTYLTDFGLARMMESSKKFTSSGVSVGTPAYMSPEQGKGEKVDHRSDIYSLGVVLFEMATGQVPFAAETPLAVLLKHITDPLPLPHTLKPTLPEQVERVILRALAKEPADRFQSAGAMAQVLETAVRRTAQQETIPSIPTPPSPPPEKAQPAETTMEPVSLITRVQHSWQTPRGKAMMIGGTAVILILFGFLINWLNRSDVAISGGMGEETAVIQPTATTKPFPTASPIPTQAAPVEASASPTTEPQTIQLPEIHPTGGIGGKVVAWCQDTPPARLCIYEMETGNWADNPVAQIGDNLDFGAFGAPSWSPDGRQILFPAGSDSAVSGQHDHNLYIINADGSGLRQITTGNTHDQEAEWSPDGQWIAFYRDCNLWRIRPDGSDEQALLVSDEYCVEIPTWSPDSQQIAFLYFQNSGAEGIWTVDADGRNLNEVYAFGAVQPLSGGVVWSPDGSSIVAEYREEGKATDQRVLVNADGSGLAGTMDGVPYWWRSSYWPQWEIEPVVGETAVTADNPVKQARAFAEPILTAIADSPPLYNMNNLGLPVGAGVSGHSSQAEGEAGFIGDAYFVKIATGGAESHACYGGDTSANLPADFVMEIDGRFLPDTNPNEDDWQIQFRKWGFGNFYVLIIRQDGHINLVRHGNNESVDLAAYYGFPVLSEPDTNHVQLIASGSETAVSVNGEQVIYIDDPDYTDRYGAGTINLGICNLGESPREVRWDNLKVWDISDLLDE